jgi:hypothetical protein
VIQLCETTIRLRVIGDAKDVLPDMVSDPIPRRVFLNALCRAGAALAACVPVSAARLLAQNNASDRLIVLCHDLRLIEQQRLTGAGRIREIDKMTGWGATVSESERSLLSEYLAKRFGPER